MMFNSKMGTNYVSHWNAFEKLKMCILVYVETVNKYHNENIKSWM